MFKKGELHCKAKGSKSPGSGPTKDLEWLKNSCRTLIRDKKLLEFLSDVACGTVEGAEIKDRLKAIDMLLDRGFGKANQVLSSEDEDGSNVPFSIVVRTVTPEELGGATK